MSDNVVSLLPEVPANDIPLMLRTLADNIESGELSGVEGVVAAVWGDEVFNTYGWGPLASTTSREFFMFSKAAQLQLE